MAQEDTRLPLLLGLAFGQRMLDGQAEWRDVPEVVRTSFLLLAKEMRRLHRLVLAQQQSRDDSPSATPANAANRVYMEDTRVCEMQAELSRLSKWARDAQRLADERHARTKRKLSKVWVQLAAMAEISADAQTQHASVSQRLAANWTAADTQLQLMQARLDAFEKEQLQEKKTLAPQGTTTDEALQQLAESQETCSQEIRRLQRALAAHDHRELQTATQRLRLLQILLRDDLDHLADGGRQRHALRQFEDAQSHGLPYEICSFGIGCKRQRLLLLLESRDAAGWSRPCEPRQVEPVVGDAVGANAIADKPKHKKVDAHDSSDVDGKMRWLISCAWLSRFRLWASPGLQHRRSFLQSGTLDSCRASRQVPFWIQCFRSRYNSVDPAHLSHLGPAFISVDGSYCLDPAAFKSFMISEGSMLTLSGLVLQSRQVVIFAASTLAIFKVKKGYSKYRRLNVRPDDDDDDDDGSVDATDPRHNTLCVLLQVRLRLDPVDEERRVSRQENEP
ncbi:hypothetical protein BBJ28_00015883 [Nothophytophthora sp. Chile5]|nr:hypothetical protein BBJ28_00015883 [Nothophytophthora sp. Chile5]